MQMGKPVVHWEFWSKDPEKISEFYEKVFDWKVQHVPEMNYRLVETGGQGGINGGIMKPQEGSWPGNMALYIDVENLETYVQKIKAAGGKIVVERMDIPNVGAFSLFEDPDGRVMGLWFQQK
jgi:predicted enzyme related to lactoylglutathione lyase